MKFLQSLGIKVSHAIFFLLGQLIKIMTHPVDTYGNDGRPCCTLYPSDIPSSVNINAVAQYPFTWSGLRPIFIERISSMILRLSSSSKGSYFDWCSFSNFLWQNNSPVKSTSGQVQDRKHWTYGMRTFRSADETVLFSLRLFLIFWTSSSAIASAISRGPRGQRLSWHIWGHNISAVTLILEWIWCVFFRISFGLPQRLFGHFSVRTTGGTQGTHPRGSPVMIVIWMCS